MRAELWVESPAVSHVYGVALLAGELTAIVFVPGVVIGCLLLWLGFPADATRAVSPTSVLRADRDAVISRFLVIEFIAFAVYLPLAIRVPSIMTYDTAGLVYIAIAIIPGVLAFTLSAWARFQVARIWFAVRGRPPWRLVAFLRDAHARGALRQAGAAYQFRHVRLQEELARSDR